MCDEEEVELEGKACDHCGYPAEYFGPNPYEEEINGIHTPEFMCWQCHREHCHEI